jgi:hypothetical protein
MDWYKELQARGWDADAYQRAVEAGDYEALILNHPLNFCTEDEVEPPSKSVAIMDEIHRRN